MIEYWPKEPSSSSSNCSFKLYLIINTNSAAYFVQFQVGAPPEIACLLDEIRREKDFCNRDGTSTCLGVDPELDEFMVDRSYNHTVFIFYFLIFRLQNFLLNFWFQVVSSVESFLFSRKPTAKHW